MPLWRIFSHPSTFSPVQRASLAQAVTQLYKSYGLPAFYVNVLFIDLEENSVFVGGEPKKNFVRVVVEQIARVLAKPDSEEGKKMRFEWMEVINGILKPHIIDRSELDWEMHIYETQRDLWRVQGVDAPPAFTEAEKLWFDENKPVSYTHEGREFLIPGR